MFDPVTWPNFRAPSGLSENMTAGRLFSSRPTLAVRRSLPFTAATFRTR